jgi:hypothetical protein
MQASILHSSWDKGDFVLAFKAGPYGGRANFDRLKAGGAPGGIINWGHDHNDDMSFWLYGSGTWLAPEAAGYDAGRRANPPAAGALFANETQYHNGLLIDGTGELGDVRSSASQGNNPWFFQRDAVPFGISSTTNYAVTGASGANLYAPTTGLTRWDRILVLARKRYALVRDDIAATGSHDFDWLCHFPDGATVDTASGWVQGAAHNAMSLGVRVLSPSSWTATTGLQGDDHTYMFEPDAKIGYVKVRPSAPSSAVQFLTALVPVSTAAWASRTRIDPLATTDAGAGAIVAPGSALEERWIFSRPAGDGKVAGDLALTSSLVGLAAYNLGEPARAFLAGAGKISDRVGARELLSSTSASSIEADITGTTLVVSGTAISDFRAYAPVASTVTLNGVTVSVSHEGSVVVYPAAGTPPLPPPPLLPPAAGPPDPVTPDTGPTVQTATLGSGNGMGCAQGGAGLPAWGLLALAGFAFRRAARRKQDRGA